MTQLTHEDLVRLARNHTPPAEWADDEYDGEWGWTVRGMNARRAVREFDQGITMPTPINATVDDLKTATVATLVDALNEIIAGANADIQTFANTIVADSIEAAAAGRLDLLADLADQVKVLAEANRLRFVGGLESLAFKIITSILGLATRLVIPTIPTIPQL